MEKNSACKLARVLKTLVTLTFICNLMVLPFVPGLVWSRQSGIEYVIGMQADWHIQYGSVLTLFLPFCGSCTAVLLWQARRVLETVLREDTFCHGNAKNMKRAAVCCFLISVAALLRVIWRFSFYHSITPRLTYNALFFPIFLMGGLLCMVMSALFRQAAELREENDLTI